MQYSEILDAINDNNSFLTFLESIGAIKPIVERQCGFCGSQRLSLRIRKRVDTHFFLWCKSCRKEKSLFANTFFCYEEGIHDL
ncbi:hypothetical protein HERIO_1006 [Hepatospora eriocheir]|uniref:Uncharacterized protein n=1 Tax=Hepatospora eriocheir TaxID=1081669 RepID=A0A1X0QBH3_9MICR|nr:hypothetical protein HERIO_1006 [Hepatospora eriocheir]